MLTHLFSIDTVTIDVHVDTDDGADDFLINRELANRHSEFTTTALKDEWKEGKEGILRLPEASPEAFQLFYDFINYGTVQFETSECQEEDDWSVVTEAWLLGDFLASTSFKDAVVDAMTDILHETSDPPVSMCQQIFRSTNLPVGMRKLLVDLAVWTWSAETLAKQPVDPACLDSFRDVAVAAVDKDRKCLGDWDLPYKRDDIGCRYHDHGSDSPCYKTMFGK